MSDSRIPLELEQDKDGSPSSPPTSGPVSSAGVASDELGEPGSVIAGKYQVERVLGRGGIGIVVSARHLELEETFAIKFLQSEALKNPVQVERFVREARLAAKIRSEHVVRVHDVSRLADGTPYMVMEQLEGHDLARELEGGVPLPADRAIDYVLQVCEALADAHSMGIVHRDLKPDNLFLARGKGGSSVKLLDFGISKTVLVTDTEVMRKALTLDTDSFGTPAYMSPEQLKRSADVDARADIWALGVVLYELLTAELPFNASTVAELCSAVLNDKPISMSTVRPDLPIGLSLIIEKCLERDREQRFRNVAELAQELRPYADVASFARVDHIVRVVSETGKSVRPPSLSSPNLLRIARTRPSNPSGPKVDLFGETLPLIPSQPPRTTHVPTSSHTESGAQRGGSRSKAVALAGVLAACAVVVIAVLARPGRGPTTSSALAASTSEPVAAAAPVPSPAVSTPTNAIPLAAPAATSAAATEASSAPISAGAPNPPLPSRGPARPGAPRARSSADPSLADAKASPAPPAASSAPPKEVVDPQALVNPFE